MKNKYIVNNLHTNAKNIKTKEVRISGEIIKAILDTGSNINIISRNLVEERGFLNLKNHEIKITNIFGQQNTLSEYVEIILSIGDINVTTQCYIIENFETLLLIGDPLIERVIKKKNEIGQLKNKFKSVFNNEPTPGYDKVMCTIDTKKGTEVNIKGRNIPQCDFEGTQKTINKLLELGYIEKSASSWCIRCV